MDTRTGIIYDFDDIEKLAKARAQNPNLVSLNRAERRKLERYAPAERPEKLAQMRASAHERNKAKAARKARRKNRK